MRNALFRILFIGLGLISVGMAQNPPRSTTFREPTLRISINADLHVYLYQTQPLKYNEGYHVYRQKAGGAFVRLTQTPVRAAERAADFQATVGEEYPLLRESLGEDHPVVLYQTLRSDPVLGPSYGFLYPRAALALGQLFVDQHVQAGEDVTYKIERVNMQDQPIGKTLVQTVHVTPDVVPIPAQVKAEVQNRNVTLSWRYPKADEQHDDRVIKFWVYRTTDTTGKTYERVNEKPILRNAATESFRYQTLLPVGSQGERYYVVAASLSNQLSPPSAFVNAKPTDATPPAIITNVAARTNTANLPEITWPTAIEPDAIGYHVYRGERQGLPFTRLTNKPLRLSETLYVDASAPKGSVWLYTITVVDRSGNESEPSNPATIRVSDQNPPPEPQNLRIRLDEGRNVQLSWQTPALPPDFKTWVVLRRLFDPRVPRVPFDQISSDSLRVPQFTDTGLSTRKLREGASYQYAVLAADHSRKFSDTLFVTLKMPDVTPPVPPANIRMTTIRGTGLNVQWSPSSSTDVTRYRLYRRTGSQPFQLLTQTNRGEHTYRDAQVQPAETYQYAVAAVDSLGNESLRQESESVLVNDGTAPRTVRNLRVSATPQGIRIRWEPIIAPDLKTYRVLRADQATGTYTVLVEIPASASTHQPIAWTDAAGTLRHWYKVVAVDSQGNAGHGGTPKRARPSENS